MLDLAALDRKEFRVSKRAAVRSLARICDKGFVRLLAEFLDVKGLVVLAVRPAPLKILRLSMRSSTGLLNVKSSASNFSSPSLFLDW